MPGLESFCVCTAIALASIYILQLTWFAAWLVIDERRKMAGRNGLLPCIVHSEDYTPSSCGDQVSAVPVTLWSWYDKLTCSWLYKSVIVIISAGLLSVGILGWVNIVHKFDPVLLLPAESYLREWVDLQQHFYPSHGWSADIYSGPLDYTDLGSVQDMVTGLESVRDQGEVIRAYDCWWTHFQTFSREQRNYSHYSEYANGQDFPELLTDFLFSPDGARYKSDFHFTEGIQL